MKDTGETFMSRWLFFVKWTRNIFHEAQLNHTQTGRLHVGLLYNPQAAVEQLRRAVARVGAQNALLAARLATRMPTPAAPSAAPAAADDSSDPGNALPGRAGAAPPADTPSAAGSDARGAPGSVLPGRTGTRAQHGAAAPQERSVARSVFPREAHGDAGALARRGAVAAQEPSGGDAKPFRGAEGVAAALARRVAALAAERRVLKALARLSLAVTTDVLTGAHELGGRNMRRLCRAHPNELWSRCGDSAVGMRLGL